MGTTTEHYTESPEGIKGACGRGGKMNTDPRQATCLKCKGTQRYLKALHRANVEDSRQAFRDAGVVTGMIVRDKATGTLGIVRTIEMTCDLGWWAPWRLTGTDVARYVYGTPELLLDAVEIVPVHGLITVGSQVAYRGVDYTVVKVDPATGVSLREVGTWRTGLDMVPTEFAAELSRGSITVTLAVPSGGESDALMVMLNERPADETMPEESTAIEAVLTEKSAILAFRNRMVLRAYRTRADTGMNLTGAFRATIAGFNAEYGQSCKSWAEVSVVARQISKEWDTAEGR